MTFAVPPGASRPHTFQIVSSMGAPAERVEDDPNAIPGMNPERARTRPLPVSCFLITLDEEEVIEACLASVAGWVDDIVVVDSGSRDRTCEIAARYGARIVRRSWQGFGPQKRAAELECAHDWLLNLDADEVVTPELADEIRMLFRADPPLSFYALPRALVYPGRSAAAPSRRDRAVRLYDRSKGRFSDKPVHESVETKGEKVGRLKHPILHYSARSLRHLTDKNLGYSVISSRKSLRGRSRSGLYARLVFGFPVVFLRTYLIRRHFLGGAQGFAIAISVAFADMIKTVTEIEARGFWTDEAGFRREPSP